MKALSLAALMTLAASLAVAKDCPAESDCMQKSCSDFNINKHVQLSDGSHDVTKAVLEATCEDRHGTKVYTWLNLKECIVNVDGNMFWSYQGNFDCQLCRIKERKSNSDPVVMTCMCFGKGKKTNEHAEINLSEGIWNYDGVIGCYKADGHKIPIHPVGVNKRSEDSASNILDGPAIEAISGAKSKPYTLGSDNRRFRNI
ncbi:cvnh domain-containing protein [Colletotrichum truncatum]|uniref:Cvnh domain-containing protein n=1 Tax=Colletotrichum truncatum TaxID=5467 RepID=A0ACC3YN85_COLTU|nr:cvnh domain-containing protein [Colletotrichum truncatum]KAF6789545.1 cvnh domain-containing protein [Colletotrichum truncatum]